MKYFTERNEVIENYAKALYEISFESNADSSEIIEDLEFFSNYLLNDENKELNNLLSYPLISVEEKINIIHEIFDSRLNVIVINFVVALTEHQRILYLDLIIQEYKMFFRKEMNIVKVQAKFGLMPSEKEIDQIKENLKDKLNCAMIEFEYEVDSELIGGVKLFYNGLYIDNTLSSKINRFIKQIES